MARAMKKPVSKVKKKTVSLKKAAKKTKKIAAKKAVVKRKVKKVSAIPKGYSNVTPYLIVNGADKAIEFYKKAFGAKEIVRMEHEGKVMHAEMKIGDAIIMLGEECPVKGSKSPASFGGSPVGIHLYIKDVDVVVKRAVDAGAKLTRAIENMFYGDRSGGVEDPFGHSWYVATHVEDLTPAKIRKRAQELFGKASSND
jgi:PhnB protein